MRITLHGSLVTQEAHTVVGAQVLGESQMEAGQTGAKKGGEGAGGSCRVSTVHQDRMAEEDETIRRQRAPAGCAGVCL